MGLVDLLLLLIVAAVCGGVAQSLSGYSRGGCLTSIALGFIGALLGSYLAKALELPDVLTLRFGGSSFPVVWSIIGASLFSAALGLMTRRRN